VTQDPRYARHTLVPGWDQARLAAAQVILIGLGALGNEVARILALFGVGSMILCDPDRVERSNLSRCAFFRESDCGRLKVAAAARALADLAPGCRLDARPQTLIHGVGLAELRDAALVIGCLDSRTARLQLAGRCNLMRAPMIDGGTHPWGGELRPYLDPDGPCYGCGLGEDARARTAAASVLIGGWMAMTALRHLLGLPVPPGLLQIDGPAGTACPWPTPPPWANCSPNSPRARSRSPGRRSWMPLSAPVATIARPAGACRPRPSRPATPLSHW
jgi:hypothetical protein